MRLEHARHLPELHRVVAVEVQPLVPGHVGERLLEVARQLVDLPAEVHVLEQRLRESRWSCARCSGVIELSICCIAAIDRAICSSSSSSVFGLPGKKSP